MGSVTAEDAQHRFGEILRDVERTGRSVTITDRDRPIAILVPVRSSSRRFGLLPDLAVPADFDGPLPDDCATLSAPCG
jgi:prevent-host-death family protein